MKKQKRQSLKVFERDNALEGAGWSAKKRMENLLELYKRYVLLTPYTYKPFVRSFKDFGEYEKWKKKQKNPWFF